MVLSNFQGEVLIYQESHMTPFFTVRKALRIKTAKKEMFSISAFDFCFNDSMYSLYLMIAYLLFIGYNLLCRLGFASCDGKIAIYNIFSSSEVFYQIVEAHKSEIIDVFFLENQFQIISVCSDHTISIWDYRNLKRMGFLNNDASSRVSSKKVRSCSFNKKAEFLITKARHFGVNLF